MSIRRGNLGWQWQEASDEASEVDLSQSWPGCGLGSFGRRRGLRFAASSAALGSGCPRGGSPGRVRTHERLHHDDHGVVVPHGRMAAWNSKEARTRARPGCSPQPGSIRSARVASVHAAPTRSLAARTAGSTRRSYRAPRPTLAHKINCVRSLPPPGREQQERAMQHADGASRASMLRCRGGGTCWPSAISRRRSLRLRCRRRRDRPLTGAGSFE